MFIGVLDAEPGTQEILKIDLTNECLPLCQFYNLLVYGSVHITDPAPNSELITHSLLFYTVDSLQPDVSFFLWSVPAFSCSLATPLLSLFPAGPAHLFLRSTLCFCYIISSNLNFLQLFSMLAVYTFTCLPKVQLRPFPGSFPCQLPCQEEIFPFSELPQNCIPVTAHKLYLYSLPPFSQVIRQRM